MLFIIRKKIICNMQQLAYVINEFIIIVFLDLSHFSFCPFT